MSEPNLYQILNVPDFAPLSEIKREFRKLALQYHPDRNPDPNATDLFKKTVKAYEILSTPNLRATYDQRLKFGYSDPVPITPTPQSPADAVKEMRRRWYEKRKEENAINDVNNFNAYEKALITFPFKRRIIIISLVLVSGIFLIVDGWFQRSSSIAAGIFLFMATSMFLWNELYKHYWAKSFESESNNEDPINYEGNSYKRFFTVFISGILAIVFLINAKKAWHLNFFGKIIEAEVVYDQRKVVYFFNGNNYESSIMVLPDFKSDKQIVYIKISTKEPEIWEFVDLGYDQ